MQKVLHLLCESATAGNLYAANNVSNTIEKFTSAGTASVFASGVNSPGFIAFTNDAGTPLPLANQAPEPASLGLLGLGACLLAARRRRKA